MDISEKQLHDLKTFSRKAPFMKHMIMQLLLMQYTLSVSTVVLRKLYVTSQQLIHNHYFKRRCDAWISRKLAKYYLIHSTIDFI